STVVLVAMLPATAHAQVFINEVRVDQQGTDTDEYFELSGPAGTSLDGLTYLVIGDNPTARSGLIEAVISLAGQSIPAGGYFLVAETSPLPTFGATADFTATLLFEDTDNVTHLLVDGFTGSSNDDLDTDDDGTLDVTPWTSVVDAVSLV